MIQMSGRPSHPEVVNNVPDGAMAATTASIPAMGKVTGTIPISVTRIGTIEAEMGTLVCSATKANAAKVVGTTLEATSEGVETKTETTTQTGPIVEIEVVTEAEGVAGQWKTASIA